MKVIVFAHQLEIGGTQASAIELAAELRDAHAFDVVLFATPGPAVALAREKQLPYVPAPDAFVHPSPARVRALRHLVSKERPDVIHAWDWWQCLDAFYVEHLLNRVPLVVSDMYMTLTRILPKTLTTTFGTPELVDMARKAGRRHVELLLPPVDVTRNAPSVVNPAPFREQYGIAPDDVTIVSVSRLSRHMKAESLKETIEAVVELGHDRPLRFVIVGDGDARDELERLAAAANDRLRRSAVILTGELLDPRIAYAAADIVVGMGGSALRGMAFGKPVIVVGEVGFSAPLEASTAEVFLYKGIYGVGQGLKRDTLLADLHWMLDSRAQWPTLGNFARAFIEDHFALERVGARLATILRQAASVRPRLAPASMDGLRSAAVLCRERRLVSYRFWQRVATWRRAGKEFLGG